MASNLSKQQRLALVFDELERMPAVSGAKEALQFVVDALNTVEDAHSGVPAHPIPPLGVDPGRMYPPQPGHIRTLPDGTIRALSRRHVIICAPDGSISVSIRRGEMLYFKHGASHEAE